MNKLLQVLAILMLGVCSLSAYALPTVTDVETSIAKEDYTKAKSQLKEVIKANPDSVVAHKYMLQVLDLEYAKTLTPSVEYKLYEANLNQINAKVAKAKADAVLAKQRKEDEEREKSALVALMVLFTIISGIGIGYLGYTYFKRRNARKRALDEETKWKSDALADVLDINQLIDIMERADKEDSARFTLQNRNLLTALSEDNTDVLNCLNNDDYDKRLIKTHISNAYEFFHDMEIELT